MRPRRWSRLPILPGIFPEMATCTGRRDRGDLNDVARPGARRRCARVGRQPGDGRCSPAGRRGSRCATNSRRGCWEAARPSRRLRRAPPAERDAGENPPAGRDLRRQPSRLGGADRCDGRVEMASRPFATAHPAPGVVPRSAGSRAGRGGFPCPRPCAAMRRSCSPPRRRMTSATPGCSSATCSPWCHSPASAALADLSDHRPSAPAAEGAVVGLQPRGRWRLSGAYRGERALEVVRLARAFNGMAADLAAMQTRTGRSRTSSPACRTRSGPTWRATCTTKSAHTCSPSTSTRP